MSGIGGIGKRPTGTQSKQDPQTTFIEEIKKIKKEIASKTINSEELRQPDNIQKQNLKKAFSSYYKETRLKVDETEISAQADALYTVLLVNRLFDRDGSLQKENKKLHKKLKNQNIVPWSTHLKAIDERFGEKLLPLLKTETLDHIQKRLATVASDKWCFRDRAKENRTKATNLHPYFLNAWHSSLNPREKIILQAVQSPPIHNVSEDDLRAVVQTDSTNRASMLIEKMDAADAKNQQERRSDGAIKKSIQDALRKSDTPEDAYQCLLKHAAILYQQDGRKLIPDIFSQREVQGLLRGGGIEYSCTALEQTMTLSILNARIEKSANFTEEENGTALKALIQELTRHVVAYPRYDLIKELETLQMNFVQNRQSIGKASKHLHAKIDQLRTSHKIALSHLQKKRAAIDSIIIPNAKGKKRFSIAQYGFGPEIFANGETVADLIHTVQEHVDPKKRNIDDQIKQALKKWCERELTHYKTMQQERDGRYHALGVALMALSPEGAHETISKQFSHTPEQTAYWQQTQLRSLERIVRQQKADDPLKHHIYKLAHSLLQESDQRVADLQKKGAQHLHKRLCAALKKASAPLPKNRLFETHQSFPKLTTLSALPKQLIDWGWQQGIAPPTLLPPQPFLPDDYGMRLLDNLVRHYSAKAPKKEQKRLEKLQKPIEHILNLLQTDTLEQKEYEILTQLPTEVRFEISFIIEERLQRPKLPIKTLQLFNIRDGIEQQTPWETLGHEALLALPKEEKISPATGERLTRLALGPSAHKALQSMLPRSLYEKREENSKKQVVLDAFKNLLTHFLAPQLVRSASVGNKITPLGARLLAPLMALHCKQNMRTMALYCKKNSPTKDKKPQILERLETLATNVNTFEDEALYNRVLALKKALVPEEEIPAAKNVHTEFLALLTAFETWSDKYPLLDYTSLTKQRTLLKAAFASQLSKQTPSKPQLPPFESDTSRDWIKKTYRTYLDCNDAIERAQWKKLVADAQKTEDISYRDALKIVEKAIESHEKNNIKQTFIDIRNTS